MENIDTDKNRFTASSDILDDVYRVVLSRKKALPESSYVAKLFSKGLDKILDKIKEESDELIEAAKEKGCEETVYEMTDLIFHCLVLLGFNGIEISDIYAEFKRRFGVSGIEEKKNRKKDIYQSDLL